MDSVAARLSCGVVLVGEETGILDLTFNRGNRFTDTGPCNHGKAARYFLAGAAGDRHLTDMKE